MGSSDLQEGLLERVLIKRGMRDERPPGRTHEDHMLIMCLKGIRKKDGEELKEARERIGKLEEEKETLRREMHTLKRQKSDLEYEVSNQLSLGLGGLYWDEHCFNFQFLTVQLHIVF